MKTYARISNHSTRSKRVMYPTAAVVFLNFFVFVAGTLYLGGDALNGYERAGHYFVCSHGSCKEVAEEVWTFSRWHAISALAGIGLVWLEFLVFVNTGDIDLDFNGRR
jgi:hypothetical protein